MAIRPSLAILPLIGSLGSTAQAADVHQPFGKWVVNYADTLCSASRRYGDPDRPVTLAFRPSPSGNVVRIVIIRPGPGPRATTIEVRTNASDSADKASALRFASRDKTSDVTWINLKRGALQRLAEAGALELSRSGNVERFELPGMAAVAKSLEACNADLRKHWNVVDEPGQPVADAAADNPRAAKPLRNLAYYVSHEDYPSDALSDMEGGTTAFVLMVGETGRLEDCMVEETSGIASIDAASCGILLQRAKFKPATDEAGKPIRSVLRSRITWQIQ